MNNNNICWITLTHGRKDIFFNSRKSWYEYLTGNITKEIIIDDSGDAEYFKWLSENYTNAQIVKVGENQQGYRKAMSKSFEQAKLSSCEYIFHLEEDFSLLAEINLDSLIPFFENNSLLSQIILKRNPVYPIEFSEGDVLNVFKDIEVESLNGISITKQKIWWSCNPNIYPVSLLDKFDWPIDQDPETHSERIFSDNIFANGYVSAYLGTNLDKNLCFHPTENLATGINY
jgi:hypothetical protein